MKCQVLHTVWCNISGETAGEIWNWSFSGVFKKVGQEGWSIKIMDCIWKTMRAGEIPYQLHVHLLHDLAAGKVTNCTNCVTMSMRGIFFTTTRHQPWLALIDTDTMSMRGIFLQQLDINLDWHWSTLIDTDRPWLTLITLQKSCLEKFCWL